MAKTGILERLAAGPVVGDGGYLLELEKRGYVQAGPFTPEVSITLFWPSELNESSPSKLALFRSSFVNAASSCC